MSGCGDDDRLALDLLIRGFQVSRIIRLVADLEIADRIAPETSMSIAALARESGVLAAPLLRAVRALAAFGIFRLDQNGNVAHTPRSLLLRADAPQSLSHSARFWTTPGSWRAWEFLDVALHDRVPHEAAWGTDRFSYLRDHPAEGRLFDAFMAHFPDNRHNAVADSYDFSGTGLVVDVGGGNGETLRRIIARHPGLRGILFDRADVIAAVPPAMLAEGRMTTQAGSFFEKLPSGADCYMLVRVLHDWPDEAALRILQSCRAATPEGSRLLIVEALMPVDPSLGRQTEYLIDMQMMAMFGRARERTEAEYGGLLAEAGFELTKVMPTASPVSILEAAPS
ncbi:ortho-methyltransferase [Sinorhizobium fredii USDA 205]|uniref:Methyltransferase n=1 Tax=Rhizobium fredii TaxID=380 RepID=A0A844A4G6_RHIFR|nr:methyltransferase [Sinorhizobium fredii]AWM26219.1 O-methyltransferase [Sinorhizobium fredii CCBAU 25509]KSV83511.1 ortho-methyltransferase [Sinorhizobium fredii USDA 205]MCG5476418.1 methyltransferase [Sinorhizobium fredii]MQW97430.1 methyltransferase [Sinorhizobium fredii]MQX07002.1 methyltransferase [Sinorhizobium fredii]